MRTQMLIKLIVVLIFLISNQTNAQNIYISPNGNDSNSGTRDYPLASLTAARDKVRELRKGERMSQNIEVIALEGEYLMLQPLEITESDGGNSEFEVVYKAEPDKKVIFRGGIELTGFETVEENLWRTKVPQVAYYDSYFEQLYVNGRRAIRARTPNEGFFQVENVTETVLKKGNGRAPELAAQKIEIDSTDISYFEKFTREDFNDALMIFYHNWDNTRKRVAGYSAEDASVFTTGQGMKPWNPINKKSRYLIENYRAALDSPGEWYLDRSGYLYYIPLKGETIENSKIIAPIIKNFISIGGNHLSGKKVENIRFENLIFEVAGYKTPPDGNEPAQAAAPVDAVITLDYADNINFINCEVAHTGTYAFWFRRSCNNCTLSQSYLHDLGAGGVKIGETVLPEDSSDLTRNITVDNNIIRDAGHVFPCAVGIILFNASDCRLTHNEIANLRYSGISAGWVWGYAYSPSKRNIIEFNHIHHIGWGELSDMGGVYTLGASEGTTVSNNVIHHIYSYDYGGWGLYTDEGSYGIVEENNLVYACKNSGFHQHYGKENIIRNNIFALNIKGQLQATRIEEHRSVSFTNNIIFFDKGNLLVNNWGKINLLSDNNCYWDTRTRDVMFGNLTFSQWQKSGKDLHSLVADPQFVDPASFDFHFKKQSVVHKIGFVPFDYSRAGVYGSDSWKKLAELDEEVERLFDLVVESMELGK